MGQVRRKGSMAISTEVMEQPSDTAEKFSHLSLALLALLFELNALSLLGYIPSPSPLLSL
jgi:hypothetical protein